MEIGSSLTCLLTDRGGELNSNEFRLFCKDMGISRQLTTAYTPQKNGITERKNRTIMNMVRCILNDISVPKEFWPEAARWAAHVLNRSPISIEKNKIPEELWSGKRPIVNYFRIFGSLAHVHVPDQKRKKLDDKSFPCVLIGVSNESKAYRLFNPINSEIIVSRDVVFEEDKGWKWETNSTETQLIWKGCDDELEDEDKDQEGEEELVEDNNNSNSFVTEPNSEAEPSNHNEESAPTPIPESSRPTRNKRPPTYLLDYSTEESPQEEESNNVIVDGSKDPSTFEEAIKEIVWRKAMKDEMASIKKNETWKLTKLPPGAKKIGVKWLFKT